MLDLVKLLSQTGAVDLNCKGFRQNKNLGSRLNLEASNLDPKNKEPIDGNQKFKSFSLSKIVEILW